MFPECIAIIIAEYAEEYVPRQICGKNPVRDLSQLCIRVGRGYDFSKRLSRNPNAIHFIMKDIDISEHYNLSSNPNAIPILNKYPRLINWMSILTNRNAVEIIKRNINEPDIDWRLLSGNPNLWAIIGDIFYGGYIDRLCISNIKWGKSLLPLLDIIISQYPGKIELLDFETISQSQDIGCIFNTLMNYSDRDYIMDRLRRTEGLHKNPNAMPLLIKYRKLATLKSFLVNPHNNMIKSYMHIIKNDTVAYEVLAKYLSINEHPMSSELLWNVVKSRKTLKNIDISWGDLAKKKESPLFVRNVINNFRHGTSQIKWKLLAGGSLELMKFIAKDVVNRYPGILALMQIKKLFRNPHALPLIKKIIQQDPSGDSIMWKTLSKKNSNACNIILSILDEYPQFYDKVLWHYVCADKNMFASNKDSIATTIAQMRDFD